MSRRCGARAVVGQSLAIVGVGLTIALAHSWIVQAGDRPIRLTSGLGARASERPPTPRPVAPPRDAAAATPATPGDAEPGTHESDAQAAPIESTDASVDLDALDFEINTDEAHALWRDELAMFIDTRLHREYEAGHIPGAFWLPADLFSRGRTPEAVNFLDQDFPVVLYCGGGDCDASKNTALLLENYGFTRLHIYTDGIPAWIQAGHPTDTGPDPITGGAR